MKPTIIVPTLNEGNYIGKCLASLRQQTVRSEIIVVDSGSTDKTIEIARQTADKVIVTQLKNIPANRQKGVEEAKGSIVVSTDADCVHPSDWLERMLSHFNDEKVVVVSGPTIPIRKEAVFLDKACYFIGNVFVWAVHKLGVVWFRGSNSAYRKDAVLKAGGYDVQLPAREDSDLSTRVAKLGRTVFDPKIIVMTSMRRRRSMGWVRTIRYYLDTPIALATRKVYYKKVG